MSFKYKYVIIGSSWEFYLNAYHDAIIHPDVDYHPSYANSFVSKTIARIHLSERINKIIPLPFKDIWAKKYIKTNFGNERNLCFLVFGGWVSSNTNILEHIKLLYPHAKVVLMCQDLINTYRKPGLSDNIDINYMKSLSDLIITFDFKEAEKYDLLYHIIPYSAPVSNKNIQLNLTQKSDVYFLGQAKNRLPQIMDAYWGLKNRGLCLNFILSNVPEDQRENFEGITYIEGIGISYSDNIANILNSKCILEIMQKNGSGYTSRTLEAIAYGKRLISNNEYLKKAPFYNPDNICVINQSSDIPADFISLIKKHRNVNYDYLPELSPLKLLEFIDEHLQNY